MFTVLNSYRNENELLYAVRDFSSDNDIEVISEEELKLLVSMHLEMKDITGNIITLDGDTLNINVEDITDSLNNSSDDSDDADDFYGSYEEDELEDFSEDNLEYDQEADQNDDQDDDFYTSYEDDESNDESNDESMEDDEDIYGTDYDDIYSSYEDEEPEGSVVSKLYENLNEEQIKVLKRYYLWYSQRLFNDAQKDPTLGLKNQKKIQAKKSALNQLRGDGEWRYAGFLDTGSIYAGYTCTLGHALRYMHLAWDITVGDIETCFFGEDYNVDFEDIINSNNCIVYGIKCIGDFFEVDSECIKNLQRAQRESLRDMAIMYDFYINNTVDEAKSSFKFMDEVVNVISKKDLKGKAFKKDYVPVLPFSVSAFYKQFRDQDMIPPKSLVQTIRSCIVGWTDGLKYFDNKWTGELRYPVAKFYKETLPIIVGAKNDDKKLFDSLDYLLVRNGYAYKFSDYIMHYIYVAYAYEICGVYKYNADTNKDEGGRSKRVKEELNNHYHYSTSSIFEDFDYSIDTTFKLIKLSSILSNFVNSYSTLNYGVDAILNENYNTPERFYLCQINDNNTCYIIDVFDKETNNDLYDVLYFLTCLNSSLRVNSRRVGGFKSKFYSVEGKTFKLNEVYPIVLNKYNDFLALYDKFLSFTEERNTRLLAEYEAKKERERIEREKEEQERREKEEAERIAREEELKARQSNMDISGIDTPSKLVDFLDKNKDIKPLDSKWNLPKDILNTVKKSGKEPSDRQLYHLKRLYKEITGEEYKGVDPSQSDKIDLSDREDLKKAIEYVLINDSLIADSIKALDGKTADETKFKGVLNSILKFGKISSRQLAYAEAAKVIYDANNN